MKISSFRSKLQKTTETALLLGKTTTKAIKSFFGYIVSLRKNIRNRFSNFSSSKLFGSKTTGFEALPKEATKPSSSTATTAQKLLIRPYADFGPRPEKIYSNALDKCKQSSSPKLNGKFKGLNSDNYKNLHAAISNADTKIKNSTGIPLEKHKFAILEYLTLSEKYGEMPQFSSRIIKEIPSNINEKYSAIIDALLNELYTKHHIKDETTVKKTRIETKLDKEFNAAIEKCITESDFQTKFDNLSQRETDILKNAIYTRENNKEANFEVFRRLNFHGIAVERYSDSILNDLTDLETSLANGETDKDTVIDKYKVIVTSLIKALQPQN